MKNHERRSAGGVRAAFTVLLAAVLLGAGLAAWAVLRPDSFGNLADRLGFLPDGLRRLLPGYQDTDWTRAVAYVPLDDRTDNLEDVELLAEASGWTILLPDRDLFRTALDGQPRNADGSAHGNREALLEWVREMDAAGCDRFILSLDQLLSGGLVHSRAVSGTWPLSFPDGTVLDEAEAFRRYILPLTEDGNNRVYIFDSVVRLSPTVGYEGVSAEEYYALREYGMTERGVPTVPDLDGVFAQYPHASDGVTPAEDALGSGKFRDYLTPELIDWYLSVRRRKLALTDSILTALSHTGNAYLLIGVDDSSNRPNIQYNEVRYLERRLAACGLADDGGTRAADVVADHRAAGDAPDTWAAGAAPDTRAADVVADTRAADAAPDHRASRARIMPGLDSLARLLLGRMAWDEYGNYAVKASVRYIGGTEGRHSSEFDLYTLEEVAEAHLDLFGAERVSESEAELQFVVMTAPDDPARADEYREELVSLLEENIERHIPTALDEASNNAYGDELERALLERVSFAGLAAYAGKYDQANVTGAAFAMGFSRYLYLKCGRADSGVDAGSGNAAHAGNADRAGRADSGNTNSGNADRAGNKDGGGTAGRGRDSRVETDSRADLAQIRQIANSMALTEYILHVRDPLNSYVERIGLDRNNMLFPVYDSGGTAGSGTAGSGTAGSGTAGGGTAAAGKLSIEERLLRKLDTLFRPDLRRVCDNLRGSRLLTCVEPWEEREVGKVRITNLHFPWNRTFEVAFDVEAELSELGS